MKRLITAIGVVATVSAMMSASAAGGFMPWTAMMKDIWRAYDHTGDGNVSMQEAEEMHRVLGQDFQGFMPWMKDHFAELDTNTDGVIDATELKHMMEKMAWTDKDMVNGWYKNTGFMPLNSTN